MQIVIDIDKELYNYMQTEEYDKHLDKRFEYQIRFAVKGGTPLPKGHGRLIDAKEVYKKFYCRCLAGAATEVLDETPTIIDADKESE